MRIVGGEARGRRLRAPRGEVARPTADRVRESIFNILGQRFEGGAALDLYAGSGALGLEALSRGAENALFVDASRAACDAVRENAAALGFLARVRVVREEALAALGRLAAAPDPFAPFALVFADPPYAAEAAAAVLEALSPLADAGVLARGARVLVEHGKRETPPEACGALARADRRRFGDTVVSFYLLR